MEGFHLCHVYCSSCLCGEEETRFSLIKYATENTEVSFVQFWLRNSSFLDEWISVCLIK